MVFHHPLHVSLTVLQKARLANCMLERSRLCRQIQLDSHQLPHHKTPEPNRQLLPNRRCQLTHRLPVSRLPTLLDRPLPRDEPQQHVPLLGKVSKRAQSKSFHSSIRPQSSFKSPRLRRALLPTTSTTTADSSSTHSVPERLVLLNGQELLPDLISFNRELAVYLRFALIRAFWAKETSHGPTFFANTISFCVSLHLFWSCVSSYLPLMS